MSHLLPSVTNVWCEWKVQCVCCCSWGCAPCSWDNWITGVIIITIISGAPTYEQKLVSRGSLLTQPDTAHGYCIKLNQPCWNAIAVLCNNMVTQMFRSELQMSTVFQLLDFLKTDCWVSCHCCTIITFDTHLLLLLIKLFPGIAF